MLSSLKGYRTYIAGAGLVCAALLKFIDGGASIGALLNGETLAIISAAAVAFFGRAAISDLGQKVTKVDDIVDAVDLALIDIRKSNGTK